MSASIFLLWLPNLLVAKPLDVTSFAESMLIGKHIQWFIGDANHIPSDDEFHVSQNEILSFGVSDKTMWLKLELRNPKEFPYTVILENDYGPLHTLELLGQDKKYMGSAGETIPMHQWPIQYRRPAFKIAIPPGNHSYYLKVQTY